MVGFLAGGRVKPGGGQGAEGVEDGLCGSVVADVGTNIVTFKEVGEAGKVACPGEGGEGVGGGPGEGSVVRVKHCNRRVVGTKGGIKSSATVKEIKVAIIVGVGGRGRGRDAGAHAGRDSGRGVGGRGSSASQGGGKVGRGNAGSVGGGVGVGGGR